MENYYINENSIDLSEYAEKMYLGYAVATLKDRAIPYLMDGQKPVQRRILYAMGQLGLGKADKKHVKSARVVGEVLGKYHPHGDSSAYEAMVRMAQEFTLRYPLIDGQGNFGSPDGDSAAAMRYTEAKLAPISELLLDELKMGTVDIIPNYDGTLSEPNLLPAKLNFMLMNGATGIAVGMATDIPPHNIRDVTEATLAMIEKPKITDEELVDIIQGPDFAGGGQIIDSKETILENYKTGKGVFRVRAKWKLEKMARGQWQIIVEELPPGTSTKSVLEAIDKIANPQTGKDKKGKPKPLSTKQQADKSHLLSLLGAARDESSKDQYVKLVLEPKSSKLDPETFMDQLMARIGLETTVKINLTTVGNDMLPKTKSLKGIVKEWIDFRFETMTRRTKWELNQINKRIHILEGRLLALANIDKVISIIKESEEPKLDLMEAFGLSEIQAEDILEIRLRQLAKLESIKIEKELNDLLKRKEQLELLLSSERRMFTLMKKEIQEATIKYEDDRRTLIKEAKVSIIKAADSVLDEPVTVFATNKGWFGMRKGHDIDSNALALKDGDKLTTVIECRSTQEIGILASNGRVYSIKSSILPTGKGGLAHINTLVDIPANCKITSIILIEKGKKALFYSENGYGFLSDLENMSSKNKAGKHMITLTDGFDIHPIIPVENKNKAIFYNSSSKTLVFNTNEIKELPKGKGVQLIKLVGNEKLESGNLFNENENTSLIVNGKTKVIKNKETSKYLGKRAQRGKNL